MNRYFSPFLGFFILVIQGCATTPTEIRALGARAQVEINQPFTPTATCLMQQIDNKVNRLINFSMPITHTMSVYPDQEYAEIVSGGFYIVSIHSNGPNNSTAKIYVSNNLVLSGSVTDHLKQAVSICSRSQRPS